MCFKDTVLIYTRVGKKIAILSYLHILPILQIEFVNESHLNFIKKTKTLKHRLIIDSRVGERIISYNLHFC